MLHLTKTFIGFLKLVEAVKLQMKFLSLRIYVCSGMFVCICRCTCILCAYTTDTGFLTPSLFALFTDAGLLLDSGYYSLIELNLTHFTLHMRLQHVFGVCAVSP